MDHHEDTCAKICHIYRFRFKFICTGVKKREVESFPGSGKGTVSTFLAFYAPYSKMAAIIVFFCFPSNYPLLPRC